MIAIRMGWRERGSVMLGAVGLALVLAAGPAAAVTGWTGPTRVVPAYVPYSPSLVVDAQGYSHVAYVLTDDSGAENAGIWYATNKPSGTWTYVQVAETDPGYELFARPSIALDGAKPHIAYALVHCGGCPTNDAIQIWTATKVGGNWTPEMRTDGFSDLAPSLVMREGKYHIAFQRSGFDIPQAGVWYLTNQSGPWVATRIASAFNKCPVFQFPSLELDAAGKARVAYEGPRGQPTGCGGYSAGLRLASNASGSWSISTVTSNIEDNGPSLDLDSAGKPHIAFNRAGEGAFYTRRTTSWTTPLLIGVGEDPSLALDAADKAHIAFEASGIVYKTNASGSWVKTKLLHIGWADLDGGQPMHGPAIALGSNGKPRITWARTMGPSEDDVGIYWIRRN